MCASEQRKTVDDEKGREPKETSKCLGVIVGRPKGGEQCGRALLRCNHVEDTHLSKFWNFESFKRAFTHN